MTSNPTPISHGQKQTGADPFPELLAFYQSANVLCRVALFVAIFWPIAVVAFSVLFQPYLAQMIVPVIDLIPLVAIVLLFIGAPFGLIIILQNPLARRGLIWLAAAIGVELSVGVYFSTIPVSRDAGLVPILVLTALAMLFLRIGGIGKILIRIFAVLLLAITLIFLLGGRNRAEQQLASVAAEVISPSNGSASPTRPCPAPDPQGFLGAASRSVTIDLRNDCFHGPYTAPTDATRLDITHSNNPGDFATIWCSGHEHPSPFRSAGEDFQLGDISPCWNKSGQFEFSLFGVGQVTVTITATRATSSSPTVHDVSGQTNTSGTSILTDGPADQPTAPKPFVPHWDKATQLAVGDEFIEAAPCIRRAANVRCYFRVVNTAAMMPVSIDSDSVRFIDDTGTVYSPTHIQFGSAQGDNHYFVSQTLPPNVPILGSVVFENVTGSRIGLLEIPLQVPNPGDLFHKTLDPQFRDLSIEEQ